MFRRDTVKDLAAVTVSLCDEEPPTWVEMVVPPGGGGGGGGDPNSGNVQLHRVGPMRDVLADPARHGMYRGTGIFCATYRVASNARYARAGNHADVRDRTSEEYEPLRGHQLDLQLVGGLESSDGTTGTEGTRSEGSGASAASN